MRKMTITCDKCGAEIKWASGRGNRPYSAMAEMPKGLYEETRIRIDLCRGCAAELAGMFAKWKKGEDDEEEEEEE